MKAQQLRTIATILNAKVTDRRKITALVAGIRGYAETITAGYEQDAIAKLAAAIELAASYSADRAFIVQLKDQVKRLRAQVKRQIVSVKVDGFRIPYSYTSGTAEFNEVAYRFLSYFRAPSWANAATAVDPTFANTVSPAIQARLRDEIKTAVIKSWDSYRHAIMQNGKTSPNHSRRGGISAPPLGLEAREILFPYC